MPTPFNVRIQRAAPRSSCEYHTTGGRKRKAPFVKAVLSGSARQACVLSSPRRSSMQPWRGRPSCAKTLRRRRKDPRPQGAMPTLHQFIDSSATLGMTGKAKPCKEERKRKSQQKLLTEKRAFTRTHSVLLPERFESLRSFAPSASIRVGILRSLSANSQIPFSASFNRLLNFIYFSI